MEIQFEKRGRRFVVDLQSGTSIAIVLNFDGPQPNHFGVDSASRQPVVVGDFVGSTKQGSGCNVDTLTLVPHCNGTHTESVGHIVDQNISVAELATEVLGLAQLITVAPTGDFGDQSYSPELQEGDAIITREQLMPVMVANQTVDLDALIVRTLPNDASKRARCYGEDQKPAFFSTQAMQLVVEMEIEHLLVDLPSVDRMYDDGLLSNHHLFWNVEQGKHQLNKGSFVEKTITEMIYVPDSLSDGTYALNIQIPPLACDAAPSRPILFPVSMED